METTFEIYSSSITTLAVMAAIMLVQLITADVTSICRKHIPGTSVSDDHSDFLFRVTRTVANTNESIAIFVCVLLFCILSGASPTLTAYGAWTYVTSRGVYAVCYYANLQTLRSICFGLSALALIGLLLVGVFY